MTTPAPRAAPVAPRLPDPAEPVPFVAAPTLALLVVGFSAWAGASLLYLFGQLPWFVAIPINTVAGYLCFTVAHDAGHHSAASHKRLNDAMGRLAILVFAPHATFPVWRFIHMQHHRFTNDRTGADPDMYTMAGRAWQRPLRWITVDYFYLWFYARHAAKRPRRDRIEAVAHGVVLLGIAAAAIAAGEALALLVLVVIPTRLAVLYLAWAFDYLPHHGLPMADKFKATRNRVGLEWLLTPALLYQNYHLVHHLHPVIPFYRYLAAWRRNEAAYLEREPSLSTVRGRPLSPDEYRARGG